MELVENKDLTMEWEKKRWCATKAGRFLYAAREYKNSNHVTITVFFTPYTAFMFIDPEDGSFYKFNELTQALGADIGGGFPFDFEEYLPLVDGSGEPVDKNIEKWGLTEYRDELVARRDDLQNLLIERDMQGNIVE